MTAPLRERRRQMLQDEILQSARGLIAEKGLAMSMDELATRVGISKPTLYSHFATKEDLIAAAFAQMLGRLLAVAEAHMEEQKPLQCLLTLLRTAVQMLLEDGATSYQPISPELIQLVRSRAETAECIQRLDAAVVQLIQRAIAEGDIDPELDFSAVVLAFLAFTQSPKLACLSQVKPSNPTVVAATLATIFERGVSR